MRVARNLRTMLFRQFAILITVLSFISMLPPQFVLASTSLNTGDAAVIAQANGDNVRLRQSPDSSATIVGSFPEGTDVQIDGPAVSNDGTTYWYPATIGGLSGYVSADFVWPANASTPVTAQPTPSSTAAVAATLPAVTSSAWIFNTNGDAIRCRDAASTSGAILFRFYEGDSVALTGDAVNGWQPVICGGLAGFVSSDFITTAQPTATAVATTATATKPATATSTATPTPLPTTGPQPAVVSAASAETGLNAVVSGTNGDGVRCRTSRSLSATVITVVYEGTIIPLRSAISGNWTEVTCAKTDGWIASSFLKAATSSASSGNGNGSSGNGSSGNGSSGNGSSGNGSSGNGSSGGSSTTAGTIATVTGTNGDGLRCRSQASFDSTVLSVLPANSTVTLRGNQSGAWWPVYCSGNSQKGWVAADYITVGGVAATNTPVTTPSTSSTGNGASSGNGGSSGGLSASFSKGDSVVVANTNGDGVRLRSGASSTASVIVVVAEGAAATVRSGSTGDWVAVTYQSSNGFINGAYLQEATVSAGNGNSVGGGTQPTPIPTTVPNAATMVNGDHAQITATLNFRTGPSTTASVQGIANEGDVVLITGAPVSGYYPVQYLGQAGYLGGDYLTKTDLPLSLPPLVSGNAGSAAATKQGQAIVDYAMKYLGYPYVWATHGPNTFDCSGFTYWVTLHTLNLNIGTGTWTQIVAGAPVQYGDLKPGDLVFFQNTYTWGLSHVGIYIGNNKFIHDQNETTGIVISDLTSPYYASRWYGARRIAN